MESLWSNTATLPSFPSLQKDTKTDVLIIGGGITGILCAYMLKHAGIDCLLAESQTIGGITRNTTAKITAQHGLIYQKLVSIHGYEGAKQYLDINMKALEKYRQLCSHIDCDFEMQPSYVYTRSNPKKIEKELDTLNKLGFEGIYNEKPSLPFYAHSAVGFPNQAMFHPLKFLSHIAKNLPIYEHTHIKAVEKNKAITASGTITADKIIVTSHFPFLNRHGSYFLKLYQQRSYVTALENAVPVDGMYIDEKNGGLSFRNYNNLLLFGGYSRRTGTNGKTFNQLEELAKQYYPGCKILYKWAAQDCIPLDYVPYIGPYSRNTENIYTASGFQKWGMTSSMVSAMLLTDFICDRKNDYARLFSPSRSILHPRLFTNMASSLFHMMPVTSKRCSHMGCAMKWNPVEHSWDCPCHGSRFEKNGTIINNPANRPLKH